MRKISRAQEQHGGLNFRNAHDEGPEGEPILCPHGRDLNQYAPLIEICDDCWDDELKRSHDIEKRGSTDNISAIELAHNLGVTLRELQDAHSTLGIGKVIRKMRDDTMIEPSHAKILRDYVENHGLSSTWTDGDIGKHCDQCGSKLPSPTGKYCDQCGSDLMGNAHNGSKVNKKEASGDNWEWEKNHHKKVMEHGFQCEVCDKKFPAGTDFENIIDNEGGDATDEGTTCSSRCAKILAERIADAEATDNYYERNY